MSFFASAVGVETVAERQGGALEGSRDTDGKGRGVLDRVWSDRRIGWLAVVLIAVAAGLVSAWLTPRGPTTSTQALTSMALALVVGVVAGTFIGNRWSVLVLALVFVVVFELARIGVVGPTVDAINPGSFYGLIALALGRVVHGLLVLAPMMLGAGYGVWIAGRLGNESTAPIGAGGWALTGLATLGLAVMAVFIARPATTAPIVGPEGEPPSGSVAELITVPIGGHDQALMIRGRSVENPVLLYLTGGPGGTDIGAVRRDVTLEQNFTVVVWDQRGAGKSYPTLDPTETFTLDQMVADTVELTNYLRDRFDQERIYLVGQSWGSTLGVLAAQQRPDLYHAFVGIGQMVSQRETDIIFWEDTLAWAEQTDNTGLVETLRRNGPPPYDNLNHYEPVVAHEHDWNVYPEFDPSNEMPAILFVPEYTFMDRVNAFRGFLDTNATVYPQLQDLDFRQDVRSLELPVYMVLGSREARGRAELAEEWFEILEAPSKERIVIEGGGHRAHFDQPGEFAEIMTGVLDRQTTSP